MYDDSVNARHLTVKPRDELRRITIAAVDGTQSVYFEREFLNPAVGRVVQTHDLDMVALVKMASGYLLDSLNRSSASRVDRTKATQDSHLSAHYVCLERGAELHTGYRPVREGSLSTTNG